MQHKRVRQHVYRIGKIADNAYYATSITPEAEAFVEFGRLELRWTAMSVDAHLNALETCSLPWTAIGRARLIIADLTRIMCDLEKLCEGGRLRDESLYKADELHKRITEIEGFIGDWLNGHVIDHLGLPQDVYTEVPGWTADELLKVVKPLYPNSQKLEKGAKLVSLIDDAIRRVPNPAFDNRFSKNQRLASEYLFDRTDALIYIAKEWGGYECCLQATLAANELGWLRDPRYIFPALESPEFNARLAAVACLAFVPSESGNERLRAVAIGDADPGVRQSALWAYGFVEASDFRELLLIRSEEDADARVCKFAWNLSQTGRDSWWSL